MCRAFSITDFVGFYIVLDELGFLIFCFIIEIDLLFGCDWSTEDSVGELTTRVRQSILVGQRLVKIQMRTLLFLSI